mgnify:CR=1 FL=1
MICKKSIFLFEESCGYEDADYADACVGDNGHPDLCKTECGEDDYKSLIERAKMMLPLTVLITLLAILIAFGSCLSVPDARTASDASIAASLPNPIAIPQSLAERTGASLMPSPTKQAPLDLISSP